MGYKCPLDGFYTETNSAMCTHLMHTTKVGHPEWIESHGLSYSDLVLNGYAPLKIVVEQKCKIND